MIITTVRKAFDLPLAPVNQRFLAMQHLVKAFFAYHDESVFAETITCLLSKEDKITGVHDLPKSVDELLNDYKRIFTFVNKQEQIINQLLDSGEIVLDSDLLAS